MYDSVRLKNTNINNISHKGFSSHVTNLSTRVTMFEKDLKSGN